MKQTFANLVLPPKTYGIWNGYRKLGEVMAGDVHEALRAGKEQWPGEARAAILKSPGELEPMFIQ